MDKSLEQIALKPCRNCAFTKNHLGTKQEIIQVIGYLNQTGQLLHCHEYSEPTICASDAARKGLRGKRAKRKGDLKHVYGNMTRDIMNKCGLAGIKLTEEV